MTYCACEACRDARLQAEGPPGGGSHDEEILRRERHADGHEVRESQCTCSLESVALCVGIEAGVDSCCVSDRACVANSVLEHPLNGCGHGNSAGTQANGEERGLCGEHRLHPSSQQR